MRASPLAPSTASPCSTCAQRAGSVCEAVVDTDLPRLAGLATQGRVAAGQSFIAEGAAAEHFFNITAGSVRLFKTLPDGRRQITGFAGPGDFLGLAAGQRYGFAAEAVVAVELCRFPRAGFDGLRRAVPALAERILAVAAQELAMAQAQILLLGRKTADERVASFLVRQAATGRAGGELADELALPMGRADIADYLGLTVETVSRTLTRLRADDVIAMADAHHVQICDAAVLMRLATGYLAPRRAAE